MLCRGGKKKEQRPNAMGRERAVDGMCSSCRAPQGAPQTKNRKILKESMELSCCRSGVSSYYLETGGSAIKATKCNEGEEETLLNPTATRGRWRGGMRLRGEGKPLWELWTGAAGWSQRSARLAFMCPSPKCTFLPPSAGVSQRTVCRQPSDPST